MKAQKPAGFMLINSKGYPDFVMTMLVVVILALLLVIIFWMGLNLLVFSGDWNSENSKALGGFISSFNENSQIIILGLCSSVFTLAGTYYLRRSSHDKNYTEREKNHITNNLPIDGGLLGAVAGVVSGFVDNKDTTLDHPHYDDEEEDI